MPTTDRNAIRYPSMADPPDGPGAIEKVAKDVDALLNRAIACTSATRPSSPLSGMLIYETDTGLVLLYRGAWRIIASSDEVSTGCRAYNDGVQNILNGATPYLSLPKDNYTSPLFTKSAVGDGHKFLLNRTGRIGLSATARFAAASAGQTYLALVWNGAVMTADGGPAGGQPTTRNVALTRRIYAGAELAVFVYQSSGGPLATVPNVDGWINFNAEWLGP